MPNETLLDAINAAIPSGEAPTEEVENEEETPEGEETPENEETPEGEEAPEGEEGGEAEGEEETPEGEDAEEGEEETPEAPKKPEKEPDPINDPLPKGTLQSTSERFKFVVGKLKEQTEARENIERQHEQLISEITGAGMGGAEFGYMLEYASGVNSGTVEGLTKARAILIKELEAVSAALGEPLPGQSPLKGHDDLIAEVNAKTLTPERANEIAVQRNRAAAQAKLGQVKTTQQQTAQQAAQEQQAGTAALTALGKELAAKDGQAEYVRKARLVVSMLQDVMPSVSPKKWAATFKAAYEKVPAAPKAAAPAKPGAKPQPLRGNKVPAGGKAKEPKNLLDAIGPAFER